MKHNIRINGEVKEIDCELGSGILDKNGREIFEGDKVKTYLYNEDASPPFCSSSTPVTFDWGVLWVGDVPIYNFDDGKLEIVDD